MIGMTPDVFWNISFQEFFIAIEAYRERSEIDLEKMSIHAAWIMAPHVKGSMRATRLYRRPGNHNFERGEFSISEAKKLMGSGKK